MSLFLLDTNVISELARNKPNEKVLQFFESLDEIVISAITIEEIEFGISRSSKKLYLYKWWEAFLSIPPVIISIDLEISKLAGGIRAQQEENGRKITQADSFIAATSIHTKRVLVTRNVKDFQKISIQIFNPF